MSITKATASLSIAALALGTLLAGCGGGDGNDNGNAAPVATTPVTTTAPTGVTKLTVNAANDPNAPSQNPTFGGTSFGTVGPYQKIIGTMTGVLDPNDPHNTVITDLALAPRNAQGLVEYSIDYYILTPVDPSKGNHKVFLEPVNRGAKQFATFNGSSGGNNPASAADAGTAFLMNQGYTMVWVGWESTVPRTGAGTNYSMGVTSPVAKNADGSSITGPDYEYIVFDNATSTSYTTAYATNSTDTTKATLTVKQRLTDAPTTIPSTGWQWTSANTIALLPAGTPFRQSAIYELTFTAKDPVVGGIGFAAVRDLVSFLRNQAVDASGTANPIANVGVTRVTTWSLSQPSRFMNDFVWLGFNQDTKGKQVFDAVFNWVGAGDGIGLNYRFEQSGRTERNRQNKLYPEAPFPFSYTTLTDPLTGKTDGRNARCTATRTCPKIMNINSANEYWVKAGSLLHTDLAGNDLADPANVRNYLISSTQHAGPSGANSLGTCRQFQNPVDQNPALRALFVALDQWVDGTEPPASAVPRRSDSTAVYTQATQPNLGIGVVPQAALGWPTIPGVLYTGLVTVRELVNFGPLFDQGILTIVPPTPTASVYPSLVSKVDADGNEIAGIRLPPVSVPVATTAGWNLRADAFGGPDGCESSGTLIPFAVDANARNAIGDPRPSLVERYGTHAAYAARVAAAANALQAQRLLLPADVTRYTTAAQQPIAVVNNPVYGSYTW